MSFYFRSFDAIGFALAFLLYDNESLDRFMISRSLVILRYHCTSATSLPSPLRPICPCPHTSFLSLYGSHRIAMLYCIFAAVYSAVHRTRSYRSLPLLLFPCPILKSLLSLPRFLDLVTRLLTIEFHLFLG